MRQAQHKNRSRSRNRRQPNPANRVYESNGPGVKVRGTAQHIADKYMQLGRDALASGDAVKAEGFFQYAEHYLRIIAAAQEQIQARRQQQMEQREQRMRGNGRDRNTGTDTQTENSSAEGNGSAGREENARQAGNTPSVAGSDAEQPVVVTAAPEGTGEQPEVQADPAWGGPQPSFLVTPAVTSASSGEDGADGGEEVQAAGDEEKGERKTVRRARRTRTTRRTKKDAPAQDATGEASAEEA